MTDLPLVPAAPAPDGVWLRQFTESLLERRPGLPRFTACELGLQAFQAMYLLTPQEAAELWDEHMIATNLAWRRLAGH
jgi:hypothetical protein